MRDQPKDGGPAFPQSICKDYMDNIVKADDIFPNASGMSLRDWFAGMALQGQITNQNWCQGFESLSSTAYQLADAMLAERAMGQEGK